MGVYVDFHHHLTNWGRD